MAYSKTNWVDNTTPIDKNNLNKIEQGIYDNSLITEAIADKLNPTDTETYKTAELTEGQITDVIGVNDIIIKGQTEQDGTPTPTNPVEVQVVKGDIEVKVENGNLVNEDNLEVFNNNRYVKFNDNYYINAEPNTAYTLSIEVFAGDGKFVEYDENNNILKETSIYSILTNGYVTITTTANTKKIKFYAQMYSSVPSETPTKYTAKCMFEKGSTSSSYTSHQEQKLPLTLGNIELCKIGNYQDYFYKSGSKWYLHKEINKKVLNGSENWQLANSGTSNYYYHYNLGHTTIQSSSIASTHYPYAFISNSNTEQGILVLADGNIRIRYGTEDTVANFKTWLATNNVSVYYPLATATNTEITDTTLISQLEAIYNAPLYEQTNITQTNNDLPMILDITACKDNINGIKAFIRK